VFSSPATAAYPVALDSVASCEQVASAAESPAIHPGTEQAGCIVTCRLQQTLQPTSKVLALVAQHRHSRTLSASSGVQVFARGWRRAVTAVEPQQVIW
jgi:hypothetical protein